MIKQSSRLYAKNWEAVGTGENLLNQEVDKEMYREIYLTDRRFNMISRAKKYVAVLLVFVCVCMIFSPLTAYAAEDSSQHETVKVGFLPWTAITRWKKRATAAVMAMISFG